MGKGSEYNGWLILFLVMVEGTFFVIFMWIIVGMCSDFRVSFEFIF